MELSNLLTTVKIFIYGQTFDVSLNWIGSLVKWLISGIGIVGVGIIVFSLLLKVIVLPFDIYQRINMRKQNIKMKENQERMEKLQKQYANDKETYNRKVMEMYRESGLSMMSSCLPMIFSMIIFIVAINGFNAYSQYSNVENYNTMVSAYNKAIEVTIKESGADYTLDESTMQYVVDLDDLMNNATIKAEITAIKGGNSSTTDAQAAQTYFAQKGQEAVLKEYNTNVKNKTAFLWIKNIWATDASYKHPILDYTSFQQEISREKFIINGEKGALNDAIKATKNSPYEEIAYNQITGKLTEQKSQANGYYILIVLSIGTILLQQFISMRSQKEQQKYSSVDGQGASQQKTTMIVMTAMFAIFAFMYSSAFSIYMIVSNITSLISTIVINKFVDKAWEKKEAKALQAKYDKRLGRINNSDKNKKN